MNAVEIEEAVSQLAAEPFEAAAFPFEFLLAYGNKATTVARLRKDATNKSDVGGVLQRSHIHLRVASAGQERLRFELYLGAITSLRAPMRRCSPPVF